MGQIENISIGGLMVACKRPPAVSDEIKLMFNLATGFTVSVRATVRHADEQQQRFGVEFRDLVPSARDFINEYCRTHLTEMRRSGRVSKRILVTIRGLRKEAQEELAETVALSRNGGLLACRAKVVQGERFELHWPEKKRTTQIEVVSACSNRTDGLLKIGFRFIQPDCDFWQTEFPASLS
jgi:PilZ domain-containing protein